MRLEGVEIETGEFGDFRFCNSTKKDVAVFRYFFKKTDWIYVDCFDVESHSKSSYRTRTSMITMFWSQNMSYLTLVTIRQQLENSMKMAVNLAKVLDS